MFLQGHQELWVSDDQEWVGVAWGGGLYNHSNYRETSKIGRYYF